MNWTPRVRKENLALKYIKENISFFEPNSTNLQGVNIIKFNHNLYALQYQIRKFPKSLSNVEREWAIRVAISKIREISDLTIGDFQDALKQEVNAILSSPHKKFFLIIPSNIKSNKIRIKDFDVFGSKIKFVTINYLKKKYSFDEPHLRHVLINSTERTKLLNSDKYFFLIEQIGRNEDHASHEAYKKFEFFRSIVNFVVDYGSYYLLGFGSQSKPRSFLFPPKESYLINNETKQIFQFITDLQFEPNDISSESDNKKLKFSIMRSRLIIRKINKIKDAELRDLLITSFYIHGDALDYYSQKWISCFHLWQIIESLSLYDNISYEDIPKRIISLLGDFHPWYDTIQLFIQKRNDFVHRGNKSEFSELDINAIKGLVQFLMLRILGKSHEFKDLNGLRLFYEGLDYYYKDIDIASENYMEIISKKGNMINIIKKMKIFAVPRQGT
ncbi:MAG: hypothetical protein ABSG49_01955 [Methanoregula sp.]|jgi:hypothetical protein|uniref:hypothetical protein n=1 Tax=Methanoregula sp. TaxID=2052170 RepID=UPI003C137EAE